MAGSEPGRDEHRVPPYQLSTWLVLGLAVALIAALFGVRLEHQPETTRDYPPRPLIPDGAAVLLPPPAMESDYVPCRDCHEDEPANRHRRELVDDHEDTRLAHGDLWCLQCHDADRKDFLRLADETLVEFGESWKLCTQCHGDKLADWRAGVHGKRTGHWRGPKEYRNCVECHDPHAPLFQPLEPKPGPVRPEDLGREARTAQAAREETRDDS